MKSPGEKEEPGLKSPVERKASLFIETNSSRALYMRLSMVELLRVFFTYCIFYAMLYMLYGI